MFHFQFFADKNAQGTTFRTLVFQKREFYTKCEKVYSKVTKHVRREKFMPLDSLIISESVHIFGFALRSFPPTQRSILHIPILPTFGPFFKLLYLTNGKT